jgi:hypothetical protein
MRRRPVGSMIGVGALILVACSILSACERESRVELAGELQPVCARDSRRAPAEW